MRSTLDSHYCKISVLDEQRDKEASFKAEKSPRSFISTQINQHKFQQQNELIQV